MNFRKQNEEPANPVRLKSILIKNIVRLYIEVAGLFVLLILIPNIIPSFGSGPYAKIYIIGVLIVEVTAAAFHVSKFGKEFAAYKKSKDKNGGKQNDA